MNHTDEHETRPYRASVTSPTEFPGLFEGKESRRRTSSIHESVKLETLAEEGREYMNLCDHNLHSVLSNPRVRNITFHHCMS